MIHYHGLPIGPVKAALRVLTGRHAFVSFAYPSQIELAIDVCQSFAIDNGAYTAWNNNETFNKLDYYEFVDKYKRYPNFDFAIIPDVIDGTEKENDALLKEWPFGGFGVPVYHLHESLTRLKCLVGAYDRIAIGSSGEFGAPKTHRWWQRINQAMAILCDSNGFPLCKLHGLRMLDPAVFTFLPLSSADSTTVNQGIQFNNRWTGSYVPRSKAVRAEILVERIELHNAPAKFTKLPEQMELF